MDLASSLQQRFQGLVLGLAMVPISQATLSNQAAQDTSPEIKPLTRSLDHAIASFGLAQIEHFLQAPSTYLDTYREVHPPELSFSSSFDRDAYLFLSALPGLVRYYSNQEMRQQWLKRFLSPQWLLSYPTLLYFGDLLAVSLRGPCRQHLRLEVPAQTALIHPAIKMAACQLCQRSADYRVAVRLAHCQSAIAASLTGSLLGAMGGRAIFSALWQTSTAPLARPVASLLSLADDLFKLWGGVSATFSDDPGLSHPALEMPLS